MAYVLTAAYIFIVLRLLRGWHRTKPFRGNLQQPVTPVTIIIAARNEEDNIGATLDAICGQQYPEALREVIVVDDHSTDRTAEIIRTYAGRGVKLLQFTNAKSINSYKKAAIAKAVEQASGKLIVTTDADCVMGRKWLSHMAGRYEMGDVRMISGPVVYHREKSFFQRMQSLEFLYLIGLGAAGIGNGRPSTCNGANLAYEREAFLQVEGFKGIDDVASGDDELLLQKIGMHYKGGIGFLKSRDAIVYTEAKRTLKDFIAQRKRWASKSTKYQDKKVMWEIIVIWIFNVFMMLMALAAIFVPGYGKLLLILLVLKITVETAYLSSLTRFAKRPELLILLPAINVIHGLYMVYIGFAGNTGTYNWKGRNVK